MTDMTKKTYKSQLLTLLALTAAMTLSMLVDTDFASAAAGGGMPWDQFMNKLTASAQGPLVKAVSVLGIVASVTTVIMNGAELGGGARIALGLVFLIATGVNSDAMLSSLGFSGASIGTVTMTTVPSSDARAPSCTTKSAS